MFPLPHLQLQDGKYRHRQEVKAALQIPDGKKYLIKKYTYI